MISRLTTPHEYPGKLFVVEGIDGSGKTTQLALLAKWLSAAGHSVVLTEWNSSALVKAATKTGKKIYERVGVRVDRMLVRGGREVFGLRVTGDSMIEAGIHDGDTIIIKRCDSADNGSIVVALVVWFFLRTFLVEAFPRPASVVNDVKRLH